MSLEQGHGRLIRNLRRASGRVPEGTVRAAKEIWGI